MVKKLLALGLMTGFLMSMTMMTAAPASAKEHHPHIKRAIKELQAAKQELQTAAHDFNGHRVDAIAAVDKAIEQLNICMQNDKN